MVDKNLEGKIVMIELEAELPNMGQMMAMPRFGITAIGSVLSGAGYDTDVLADCYGKVTLDEVLRNNPDYIMFNGMTASLDRVRALAQKIKQQRPGLPIIIGGEAATQYPEKVQDFTDYIVLNEGDKTIIKLVEAIKTNSDLSQIKGIMYKKDDGWKRTEQADRVIDIDYKLYPTIFRGITVQKKRLLSAISPLNDDLRLRSFPIQTSRGCRYNCSFCTQKMMFGKTGYINRDIENVLEDIDKVMETGMDIFMFVDNLFGGNKDQAVEFFEKVIDKYDKKRQRPTFSALMRADQFSGQGEQRFTDYELDLMEKAGLKSVSIGMESVNQETLDMISKGTDTNEHVAAVERLKQYGINVTATFGVGGENDTQQDIRNIVEFAKQNKIDRIYLYGFGIAPGTREYKENRHQVIQDVPDRYINGHAVTILPKKMLPSELQELSLDAMDEFYTYRMKTLNPKQAAEAVLHKRQIARVRDSLQDHLERLRELETDLIAGGVYTKTETGNYELNEDLVKEKQVSYHG